MNVTAQTVAVRAMVMRAMFVAMACGGVRVGMHSSDFTRRCVRTHTPPREKVRQVTRVSRVSLPCQSRPILAALNGARETELTSLATTAYHGFQKGSQGARAARVTIHSR